jgi:AcrR family transcriptional regulator
MKIAKPSPKNPTKKRVQGRPVAGKNDVGSERLLIAAEQLLQTMPPARVNILRIAEAANADPALVRYYFGDRIKLLMAVADRVIANAPRTGKRGDDPQTALADRIAATVQFVRRAPFMHRLMIDELTDAGTDESRARVREMNLGLVDFYRQILSEDGGAEMIDADPLLLHLAVLGASDFFASAEPLIRELVPEGTDMETITTSFQAFLVNVFMNGLRKR